MQLGNFEKEIELSFKLFMIIASLGIVANTIKNIFSYLRKYVFYFRDLNERLNKVETKTKSRVKRKRTKPKGEIKK